MAEAKDPRKSEARGTPRSTSLFKASPPARKPPVKADEPKAAQAEPKAAREEPLGASSGAQPSGTTSYSSTIAAANTAETATFPDRYGYVTVTNLSATAPLYVRTDGQAAAIGAGSYVVAPGQSLVVANGLGTWFQSQRVIPNAVMVNANGPVSIANPSNPSQPATAVPMEAAEGGAANPGTSISLFSGTVGGAYTVEAAG